MIHENTQLLRFSNSCWYRLVIDGWCPLVLCLLSMDMVLSVVHCTAVTQGGNDISIPELNLDHFPRLGVLYVQDNS